MTAEWLAGDKQRELLRLVDYTHISRGAHVLLENLQQFLVPSDLVLNVGCGPGEKAVDQSRIAHLLGLDINPKAIENAKMLAQREGVSAEFVAGDVTNEASVLNIFTESAFKAVVAEGLFCNLIGEDLNKALDSIGRLLAPGGRFYVADCLLYDLENVYMWQSLRSFYSLWVEDKKEVDQSIRLDVASWQRRYQQNVILSQIEPSLPKLEYGTFIVIRPDISLPELVAEMGQPMTPDFANDFAEASAKVTEFYHAEYLQQIVTKTQALERFARHVDFNWFNQLCAERGLVLVDNVDTPYWISRGNSVLPGFRATWQKTN